MRTDFTQVYKKKNTRNTLTIQQMNLLCQLGLASDVERDSHTDSCFGVEELMQILPSCIVAEKKMYCLQIYKTAFDIQAVRYYNPSEHYTLVVFGCDDVVAEDALAPGNLVDALFNMVLWVNKYDSSEFSVYKGKLQHYIKSK